MIHIGKKQGLTWRMSIGVPWFLKLLQRFSVYLSTFLLVDPMVIDMSWLTYISEC
jgi:hypothetical protein